MLPVGNLHGPISKKPLRFDTERLPRSELPGCFVHLAAVDDTQRALSGGSLLTLQLNTGILFWATLGRSQVKRETIHEGEYLLSAKGAAFIREPGATPPGIRVRPSRQR
jgi:hypothetical protein